MYTQSIRYFSSRGRITCIVFDGEEECTCYALIFDRALESHRRSRSIVIDICIAVLEHRARL